MNANSTLNVGARHATPAPVGARHVSPSGGEATGAIIVAANLVPSGEAFDPFWAPLAGQPLIAWTIAAFERAAGVDEIVLIVAADRLADTETLRDALGWQHVRAIVAAGPRRRDSVLRGLEALPSMCRWITMHDGARPLIEPERITAGIEHAQAHGSAIAHTPVQETIKRTHESLVIETPPRAALALLQTPQIFQRERLLAAYHTSDPLADPADDATLALACGVPLSLYPGSIENIEVRAPDDLALAESLLLRRQQQHL